MEARDLEGRNKSLEEGQIRDKVDSPGLGSLEPGEQKERRNQNHGFGHAKELAARKQNVTLVLHELCADEYRVQN